MSNLERRNGILRREVRMRLGPGEPLGIRPGFVSGNIAEPGNPVPENVINRLVFKINKFKLKKPVVEDKTVVNLEEFKAKRENTDDTKTEIAPDKYNPKKGMSDKLDRVNTVMQRIRRGRSGCRCQGEVKKPWCKSRSCQNNNKEAKPINITANSPQENKGSKRIRAGISVRVGNRKLRAVAKLI